MLPSVTSSLAKPCRRSSLLQPLRLPPDLFPNISCLQLPLSNRFRHQPGQPDNPHQRPESHDNKPVQNPPDLRCRRLHHHHRHAAGPSGLKRFRRHHPQLDSRARTHQRGGWGFVRSRSAAEAAQPGRVGRPRPTHTAPEGGLTFTAPHHRLPADNSAARGRPPYLITDHT